MASEIVDRSHRRGSNITRLGAVTLALAAVTVVLSSASLAVAGMPAAAQRSRDFEELVAVDAPVVALTRVKVIDGTGAPARDDQTIVIREGRIAAVGDAASVQVPDGAEVLDLAGHTVIPGLVGLHDHSYYTAAGGRAAQLSFSGPRLYLASGVTTIRTTGSRAPYEELNLKAEIDAGNIPGPTIFTTGPYLTGERGSMTMTQLSGPEDARRVVRYWSEEGVSWFKAYTWISREELAAAIEEAHEHGIKVTGHLCSVSFREAVALGIDNLEHGFLTNTDYDPEKEPDQCPSGFQRRLADVEIPGPEVQRTFQDMIDAGVAMTSTLAVYENFVCGRPPIDERNYEMLAPEIAEAVRAQNLRYAEAGPNDDFCTPPELFEKALKYEHEFVEAGGLLASGVDPTGYGAALPGFGDQRNFELLLEAGFTPEQVVQILSANGAKVLGIYDRVGSIEAGKVADLVVIDGDPTVEGGDIEDVTIVFKEGLGFDSAKLLESIKGVVGIR